MVMMMMIFFVKTRRKLADGSMSAQRKDIRQQLDWQVVYRGGALIVPKVGGVHFCVTAGGRRGTRKVPGYVGGN